MATTSKLNGATTANPRTKYLTVLESVDELLRCENVLPSNDDSAALLWQIHPVKGFLIAPEIMLNLQFSVKRIKKGKLCYLLDVLCHSLAALLLPTNYFGFSKISRITL